jgi:hypothetical protein
VARAAFRKGGSVMSWAACIRTGISPPCTRCGGARDQPGAAGDSGGVAVRREPDEPIGGGGGAAAGGLAVLPGSGVGR